MRAVHESLGVIDVSTLGKLFVEGPEAVAAARAPVPEPLRRHEARAHPLRRPHLGRRADHGRRHDRAARRRPLLRDDHVDGRGLGDRVVRVVERRVGLRRRDRQRHGRARGREPRRAASRARRSQRADRGRRVRRGVQVPRRAGDRGRRRADARAPDRLRRRARVRAPLPEPGRRAPLGRARRRGRAAVRPRAAARPPPREGARHRRPGHGLGVEPLLVGHVLASQAGQGRLRRASFALEHFAQREEKEKLVGFTMEEDVLPAEGAQIVVEGLPAGRVTSARRSEAVGAVIGLAWVPTDRSEPGTRVEIRGRPAAPRGADHAAARSSIRPGSGCAREPRVPLTVSLRRRTRRRRPCGARSRAPIRAPSATSRSQGIVEIRGERRRGRGRCGRGARDASRRAVPSSSPATIRRTSPRGCARAGALAYDATGALAGIAIASEQVVRRLTDLDLDSIPTAGPFARVTALFRRGEDGWIHVYVAAGARALRGRGRSGRPGRTGQPGLTPDRPPHDHARSSSRSGCGGRGRSSSGATRSSSSAAARTGSRRRTTSRKRHGIRDVAILEKSYIGSGASGRNTTIIRSNYRTPEGAAFYGESVRLYERLSKELDFNLMFSQHGHLTLAHSDRAMITMQERAEVNKLLGINSSVIDPDADRGALPGARPLAAARVPDRRRALPPAGRDHPPRRRRLGIRARGRPARRRDPPGHGGHGLRARVATASRRSRPSRGRVECGQVVSATAGWSSLVGAAGRAAAPDHDAHPPGLRHRAGEAVPRRRPRLLAAARVRLADGPGRVPHRRRDRAVHDVQGHGHALVPRVLGRARASSCSRSWSARRCCARGPGSATCRPTTARSSARRRSTTSTSRRGGGRTASRPRRSWASRSPSSSRAGETPDLIAPFAMERFHTDTLVSELAAAAVSH